MGLTEGVDTVWKDAAQQLKQGWMHINGLCVIDNDAPILLIALIYHRKKTFLDQRNPPGQDRIGAPDDIIGSVWVENSKVGPFQSCSISTLHPFLP